MGRAGSSGGTSYLVGFKEMMVNLNREIGLIEGRTMKGLIAAAAMIKEETLHGALTTPKDVGNLRASWFVVTPTSVPSGRGTANFKDNPKRKLKASRMISDHTAVISECQGTVASMSAKDSPVIMLGYSAFYSGFVHEMVGATNWTTSGSGAKWFEAAIKNKKNTILKVIGENARIKG
jgi:hypothetical protein